MRARIGLTYSHLCRDAEAVDILRQTEKIALQALGQAHVVTLRTQLFFIRPLTDSSQLLEAEERAIALQLFFGTASHTRSYGMMALDVKTALGIILLRTSRLNEARDILALTHQRAIQLLGPEHPLALRCLYWLAFACRESGRLDEALEKLDICVISFTRVLGLNHPENRSSMRLGEDIRRQLQTHQHSSLTHATRHPSVAGSNAETARGSTPYRYLRVTEDITCRQYKACWRGG